MNRTLSLLRRAAPFALLVAAAAAPDQASYDLPPINYSKSAASDPMAALQAKIDSGAVKLAHEPGLGYLRSFLAALDVLPSSQTLVFSKTSFQRQRIGPRTPRALYFNDDIYVGWVKGGEVMEVSGVDPQLGSIFYTFSQTPAERPKALRQTDNCLQCHDSRGLTLGVPGHIVRSVFAGEDGNPHLAMGTYHTTPRSPYAERWGGWYVTGEHGSMRHLGNVLYEEDPSVDLERLTSRGANVKDLSAFARLDAYLRASSDIVALLVLEHQTHVHNLITRANHETRVAVLQSDEINRLLGTGSRDLTEGTRSRIRAYGEPLVEAIFFSGEPPFPDPVKGNTSFAADFEKRGPFDAKGRSLRQFDLRTRTFKHPCSYLVYSKAFAGLPPAARAYVSGRMRDILLGRDASKEYAHLTAADRAAILGILRETLPSLAADWK